MRKHKKFDMNVQLRLGKSIIEEATKYSESLRINRNKFIRECIEKYLFYKKTYIMPFSLTEALRDKKMLLIRMHKDVMDLVDAQAIDARISRTIWVTDAILAGLQRAKMAEDKRKVRDNELGVGLQDNEEYSETYSSDVIRLA